MLNGDDNDCDDKLSQIDDQVDTDIVRVNQYTARIFLNRSKVMADGGGH